MRGENAAHSISCGNTDGASRRTHGGYSTTTVHYFMRPAWKKEESSIAPTH